MRSEGRYWRWNCLSTATALGLAVLIAGSLAVVPAFGEPESLPLTLDAVVVTAEKQTDSFQTGDVDQSQTPAFHTVIRRDAFEGRRENLAEVIEKEAGIQIRQFGGLGSFSSVSLRGSSADQVTVYLDGVLINDASGGGVDLSRISLADVEAVEIYRGITPVNFSQASVGGAVHIRTLRSGQVQTQPKIKAIAGYGDFDTRTLSAFITHAPRPWHYLFSADYQASDNDFKILNDNGTPLNPHDDRWEKRRNEQFEQANILGKVSYNFSDRFRLAYSHQWFTKDQGLPSWNNSPINAASFDVSHHCSGLQLFADNISRWRFNTVTRLDYTDKKEVYDDQQGHIGLGRQHLEYRTRRLGGDIFMEKLTESHNLSLLLAGYHETYSSKDRLYRKNPNDSARKFFSLGFQDSIMFWDERLIVTPALRLTMLRDELESAVSAYGITLDKRSRRKEAIMPQIGLTYRPAEWLTLKSNIAQYTREPSFFELFGDRGFFMGNDKLEAEKGINADAGLELRRYFRNQTIQAIKFQAAGFMSQVDNLITRVYDTRGIGKADNISESAIKGIEAGLSADFLHYFALAANYTWQDTENKSRIPIFNGKKLPGRYETSWFVKLEARWQAVKIFSECIIERGMYYDTANFLKAKNRQEFNAGISFTVKHFILQVQVNNIGDDRHEAFNGYPRPGISYFSSITFNY